VAAGGAKAGQEAKGLQVRLGKRAREVSTLIGVNSSFLKKMPYET